jgi:hypothetical protein
MRKLGIIWAFAALAATTPANASVVISTLPEFNGNGTVANTFIGTFSYVIPAGETIVSATFESTFGNTQVNSSATGDVTVDGVIVGSCPGDGNPCWNGPGAPITYNFLSSEFTLLADGSADLFYNQTDCCTIRLGASTLTITTAASDGVPEPSTWAMMLLGFGLVGGAVRYGRRKGALSLRTA